MSVVSSLCLVLIDCGGDRGGGAAVVAAPTVQFSAPAPGTSITLGQSTNLIWTSSGANACVASDTNATAGNFGGGAGTEPVSGTATVTPTGTGSFTYTISCTGDGGTASASVALTVAPPPQPPPATTVTATMTIPAQDGTIALGGEVPVTWQSSNATSCVGSSSSVFAGPFNAYGYTAGGQNISTSGTYQVIPVGTGNFTYTVTCSGPSGTATATASVVVTPAPGAGAITITSPVQGQTITLGQSVNITFQGPAKSECFVVEPNVETGFGNNAATVTDTPTTTGTVTYGVTCSESGGPTSFAYAPTVTVMPDFVGTGKISAVGSTTDPTLHNMHPKGLALATATAGPVTAGDLLTCNFADSAGNAGQGSTVVGVHPAGGAAAYSVGQSAQLSGCNALTTLPDGTLFVAAYTANQVATLSPAGAISAALPAGTIVGPSGIAYAGQSLYVAAIDLTQSNGGSIYRVTLNGDTVNSASLVQIVSGLCTSGTPGALYGPVALTYGPNDTLYIADTSSGQVIEISQVSTFTAAGQFVPTCGGTPPTGLTKVEGTPQEDNIAFLGGTGLTPVGIAVLPSGNLLVANGDLPLAVGSTPPPANSVIEILGDEVLGSPRQLDTGAPGALSGIVATQDSQGNPIVYFTDANTNSIMELTP